ncbi:MAG: hypothetical protein JSS07_12505 [Proteobacteria bacterium]|nr:hypothetical protein [Pseudomonadota bacterium]
MGRDNLMMLAALAIVAIQGCRWNDDFRSREQPTYLQQPQYLEPPPSPTLNVESEDYQGNDTGQTAQEIRETPLPDIDGLSPIPEIQEAPGVSD